MLSANDVALYAAEFEDLLSEDCVITRATNTSDGMGGQTSTWAAVGTVLCNVSPMTGPSAKGAVGAQVAEAQARMVTLPAGTDVALTDRLTVGAQTLEVTDMREPRTYEFVRRVEARII